LFAVAAAAENAEAVVMGPWVAAYIAAGVVASAVALAVAAAEAWMHRPRDPAAAGSRCGVSGPG